MSQASIPVFDPIKAKAKIAALVPKRSVANIAAALGYERQTVGHWLRGRGDGPKMQQIHRLAEEIGCHWLELIRDDATVINDPAEKRRFDRLRRLSAQDLAALDKIIESMDKGGS